MNRRHFFARIASLLAAPAAAAVPCTALTIPSIVRQRQDDCPEVLPPLPDIPPWLAHWRNLPRQPVWESADPTASRLIAAAERSSAVSLIYHAGSTPGQSRLFSPACLFRTAHGDAAPLYVSGWCHQRRQHRTLRLDHISLVARIH